MTNSRNTIIRKVALCVAFTMSCIGGTTAQTATVYTTTADGNLKLSKASVTVDPGKSSASKKLLFSTSVEHQTIEGFGFALTYSSCYNLMHMSESDRDRFLRQTYSPTEGYGVSYARIAIGSCDFSSHIYSLCDEEGLEHFALQDDETKYIVPILKEIIAINPAIKIIAAPWSCPRWMKSLTAEGNIPWAVWTGGYLNPQYRQTYADYFVKFIETMKQQGINIYAVTPQNEPLNGGNTASTKMPWNAQAEFVKVLASTFKQKGIGTKIYVYDHNFNYDDQKDQNDYPIKVYDALGTDFNGSELVVGSAYHDYGGDPSELSDIHRQRPDKQVIFTEASLGDWNDGRELGRGKTNVNSKTHLNEDMERLMIGLLNKYCTTVTYWNLMLDNDGGPKLRGGCQTCYGAVDIDQKNYSSISLNRHYYVISHASAVVRPGAVWLASGQLSGIASAAFRNTDGSFALLISNNSASDIEAGLSDRSFKWHVDVTLPAESIVSVLIPGNGIVNSIKHPVKERTDDQKYYSIEGKSITSPIAGQIFIHKGKKAVRR